MKKLLKNRKLWSVVVLALVLVLSMSAMVFAANADTSTVNGFIAVLTGNLRTIATAFVVLAAIATAVLYMAGAVNTKFKDKGKDALYALIIGVIVLVFSSNIKGWIESVAGITVGQ